MVIKVINRVAMENVVYDPEKVDRFYIISIYGDGMKPFDIHSQDFLQLNFDDIEEKEYSSIKEKYPELVLFNEGHAKQIMDFLIKIRKEHKKKLLLINCYAGISRSGAVGKFANEYFNEKNKKDYIKFFDLNQQIKPNHYIYSILTNYYYDHVTPRQSAFGTISK